MKSMSIRLEIVGPEEHSDFPEHGPIHVIQVGIRRGKEVDSGRLIAKTNSTSEAIDQVAAFLKGFLSQQVDLKAPGEIDLGKINLSPSRRRIKEDVE